MSQAAVAYLRVSTQEQANEGVSLAAQEAQVRAYAQLKGLNLVAVLVDKGVSGAAELSTRPAGVELLGLVKQKKVSVVLAVKLDRLFRSAADALNTTKNWDDKGVALHLLDLGGSAFASDSALGRFFLTIMAGAAELEKNLVSERTKAALSHKRSKGERISGCAPYGFQFFEGNVVEDKEEQKVLNQIRALSSAGYKPSRIAKLLNSRSVPARGILWYDRSIRNILEAV